MDLDETQPALQVAAAVYRKPKTGAGKPNPKVKDRGDPHPDGPPETACYAHWRFGKSAYFCKKKSTCPWRDFSSKSKNNSA